MIALAASILQASSGLVKNKQKIIYMHSVQKIFGVISNLVLCGITGALMNLVGFIRNVLCYKHKLGIKEKIILIILSTALSLSANEINAISLAAKKAFKKINTAKMANCDNILISTPF